jgi:outer membrane protein assembly factor BamD (BamD/ComL family)
MKTRLLNVFLLTFVVAIVSMGCDRSEDEARQRLGKGMWLQSDGEFRRAKEQFEYITSEYPDTKAAQDARRMLDQLAEVMVRRAQELKEQSNIAAAERLCGKIIDKYPGTKQARAAQGLLGQIKEGYNRVAYDHLRRAHVYAQKYFYDYPGGTIGLEGLHYYGLDEIPGVTIDIIDDRQDQLVMTSEHASGNKLYTIFFDGRIEEAGAEMKDLDKSEVAR